MLEKGKIEKRLVRAFFNVTSITALAAVIAFIAVLFISARYNYALHNFGFAQGDIGKAMFEFADLRSSLRATIGYDNQEAIDEVVNQHDEMKTAFEKSFATVKDTVVSKDGKQAYEEITAELEKYMELDARIMELGATTDRERCKQAQELALNELADVYNGIYDKAGMAAVREGKRRQPAVQTADGCKVGTGSADTGSHCICICRFHGDWKKDCKRYCKSAQEPGRPVGDIFSGRYDIAVPGDPYR